MSVDMAYLEHWILSASEKQLRFISLALMTAALQTLEASRFDPLYNGLSFALLTKSNCSEADSLHEWLGKTLSSEQLSAMLQKFYLPDLHEDRASS